MATQLPLQNPLATRSWMESYGDASSLSHKLEAERQANALTQNQLNFAPQMSQAEIGEKNARAYENMGRGTNYFEEAKVHPSQIAENYARASESPYKNALTAMETKYIPERYRLENEKNQRLAGRFGDVYQFSKLYSALPAPLKALYASQHPDEYNQMLTLTGNNALNSQQPMGTPSQQPSQVMPQAPQGNQNVNALTAPGQQQPPPQPVNQVGAPVIPPSFAQATPQQIADFKRVGQMTVNKSLSTAASERQMEGAIQVENIINDPVIQSQAMNAAKYAGALGRGKAAAAALSQTNPESYEDYLAFKNQTMVLLQNRIKTLDQMGATDKQREELTGLYDKTMNSLTSNPQQFIKQWNKLGSTLDTVARSVQKSVSPVSDVNRLEGFKPIGEESQNPQLAQAPDDVLAKIAAGGQ